ncbi:MAG: hypothetical protein M1826_006426 [Phylliscum demangeonii]|nr:MAG: hypothetical protein M1826_006426 [Phylliscum demangeonii]
MLLPRALRPFPLQLSIGTDICHVPRITRIITQDGQGWGARRFMRRILTPAERQTMEPKLERFLAASTTTSTSTSTSTTTTTTTQPAGRELQQLSQSLAGRFAAKEATKKAFGSRRLSWHDISVRLEGSRPYIVVRASRTSTSTSTSASSMVDIVPDIDAPTEAEDQVAQLSLSHDGEYAVAMVLAAATPSPSPVRLEITP